MNTALMTDRYELTMLQSFIESGKQNDLATFEVFTRRLPEGRRFGVFAGLGRLVPMIENFSFSPEELTWLVNEGVIDSATDQYLQNFKFSGTIHAYAEGDIFFPHSPVVTITGPLGELIVLETLILSVLNFDSAIATTASRMVMSAKGKPIIEMGSRRTNEDAAVAAARAAYIAGFASTSNLLAGMRYDIPTVGTSAHAFTLAHHSETEAFEAQVKALGKNTSLLIDTYDIEQGIRNAVEVAGTSLGAIRIDSGDLAVEATKARRLLDELGAYATRIIVTSDIDEYIIKDLQDAPINGFGVGTKLVSSAPMGFVYKLVEINGRAVAKKSKDKNSRGGRKFPWRLFDHSGQVVGEVFTFMSQKPVSDDFFAIPLYRTPVKTPLAHVRKTSKEAVNELPIGEQKVWHGDFGPFITVEEWEKPS